MRRLAILVAFVVIILSSATYVSPNLGYDRTNSDLTTESQSENVDSSLLKKATLSDHVETEGTLNPVVIEQRGNKTNPTLHAETDSITNTRSNLTIDTLNNWVGSRASVELTNLKRLYVANGSFSEGIAGSNINPLGSVSSYPYGWDAISDLPNPSMVTTATYSLEQVYVEITGERVGQIYYYTDGTYVYWTQTVNNTPYLEDFILNFDYNYERGPIDNSNVTLRVYIDDDPIWTTSSVGLTEDVWYNSGDVEIPLTGIGSQFEFKIGMYIDGTTTYDHKDIQFIVDNVQFVGATTPTFDDATMTLSIGLDSAAITGTGVGVANITSVPPWQTENVPLEISSDLGYSFDYTATLLSHRYVNSTKSLSLIDEGAHFSALVNDAPQIGFHTFIGSLPDLDDFSLYIWTTFDWENASVFNPSATDVTSLCSIVSGMIKIPNALVYNLGWWTITCEAPNYLRSVQNLKLVGSTWLPDTIYRSSNISKPMIEIGGTNPLATSIQNVNITWSSPDDTVWYSEVISGGFNGEINGTELEFGSTNMTAGRWEVLVFWTNGTEIAYGGTPFSVYHSTSIAPEESLIEQDAGYIVTNFVYFKDSENNEFLLDPTASITANWSFTTVIFVPDIIHNRWIATFDTSLVEPGDNLVVVNASRTYFDDASCTFIVRIRYTDNQLKVSNPTGSISLGDKYTVYFNYTDVYGTGIEDADTSIVYSGGPAGGITWGTVIDLGGGDYSIEFTSVHRGDYIITLSASRDYYEASQDTLVLNVRETNTTLSLENGTSAIIGFGEQYRLVLRYTNASGYGLDGAIGSIISTTPATGISYGNITSEGDGYYSVILTPEDSDSFTLVLQFSLADHTTRIASFTLTATLISTHLRVIGTSSPASVGVGQPFELLVFYEGTGSIPGNISEAHIELIFTSLQNLNYSINPLTQGYLISFQTDVIGSYEFHIYTEKIGYQSDYVSFTLFVQARGMKVVMNPPVWIRLSSLEIMLQLQDSITNEAITNATVSYWLVISGGTLMEGDLIESEEAPGNYSVTISPDWIDSGGYSIRILAQKSNYELDDVYQYQIIQYTPDAILWQIIVETYGPPVGLIAFAAIVTVAGQRVYSKKQHAKQAKVKAIKSRLSDANNLLGVIVLHKLSGIPIYSKVLKAGLEEGMLSAFITAIMHFRSEFESVQSVDDEYHVLPISDIIRAIPTKNLVCAFITITSPSHEQEAKMEGYARAIGITMDDILSQQSAQMVDVKTAKTLEWYFDDFVDGELIRKYQVAEKKLPKRFRIIEESLEKDIFSLNRLIRNLEAIGLSEDDAYLLVMDAIEEEVIVPIYSFNGDTPLVLDES